MSSYGLLYEHSFLKVNCTANGQCLTLSSFVIPVPRHWDPAFLQSHRKRFSMLVCLLTSKLSWIPVSSTGMTSLLCLTKTNVRTVVE
ncbi:WPE palindromic element domain-containing protein [Wolbachia endosymbiont (group B) of Limnophora tigrina]|uniref:WPE palindromic element domain-containing protein n=1 Tax=Wolbachia endosymbiont (group B) of Limnophora tigrina TaxID=3139317 RepID=UPI0035B546A3